MVLGMIRDLGAAHERLKKRIHAYRLPLSKNGQRAMSVVYFTAPIIGGYFVMKWAERRAARNFELEEEGIRNAVPMATERQVRQQNDELRKVLQQATRS